MLKKDFVLSIVTKKCMYKYYSKKDQPNILLLLEFR